MTKPEFKPEDFPGAPNKLSGALYTAQNAADEANARLAEMLAPMEEELRIAEASVEQNEVANRVAAFVLSEARGEIERLEEKLLIAIETLEMFHTFEKKDAFGENYSRTGVNCNYPDSQSAKVALARIKTIEKV